MEMLDNNSVKANDQFLSFSFVMGILKKEYIIKYFIIYESKRSLDKTQNSREYYPFIK
jgi:hypothetical protein